MRLGPIKQLSKDSVVYGLGTAATKMVGFLLIPVYTRYLTPGDYGVLALINMWGALLGILIGLGQHSAVFRFYFKDADREEGSNTVISTFLGLVLVMGIPCLLLAALARPLARALLDDASLALLVLCIIAIHYMDLFSKASLIIVRARRWTARYSGIVITRTFFTLSMIIAFVVGLGWGIQGVLTAQVISGALFTAVLAALFLRGVRPRFSPDVARRLLAFGLPLVPGQILYFVFRFSNRYFLKEFGTVEDVGLFSLGNRFGESILLLNTAIQTAWPVFLYGSEKDRDAPALYGRAMTYYLLLAGFGGSALILFTPEIFGLLVAPAFHSSMTVIPLVVPAYILMGVHLMGNVGVNLKEKTHYYIWIAAAAAVVSVAGNLFLIPRAGMLGAATATLLAYATQAVLTLWFSLRLFPVQYEPGRVVRLLATLAAVTVAGRMLPLGGPVTAAAAKTALLLAGTPLLLALIGFFSADERTRIRNLFTRRTG